MRSRRQQYKNFVRELYESSPEQVESVYEMLYSDSLTWEREDAEERLVGCIELDANDAEDSWAFIHDFEARYGTR